MKGLLKYLSPFSPDQSGAVSVLFSLGGIIVICDAGGCTGNICGFDEPRWFHEKSAVFSAGLRDMDAILGRDDKLVAKLKDAADYLGGNFAAIIGTPVPAVIATDLRALKRMAEKKCQMPVMAVECTGTRLYDEGASLAWLEVFRTFAEEVPEDSGKEQAVGILGLTPLDISRLDPKPMLEDYYRADAYDRIYCYGMGDGIDTIRKAGTVKKNIVVSPAALKAADYLKKRFGTPYECAYPLLSEAFIAQVRSVAEKAGKPEVETKILIVHQQVAAEEIRKEIYRTCPKANVICGSWFMQNASLKQGQDVHFDREERFIDYVKDKNFDVIIADPAFKRALKWYEGTWIDAPHFAVSGTLERE